MQFRCFSTFQACRRKFSRFFPIWIYTCSAALDTHRGDPGCPGLWVALSVQRERTAAVQSHLIDFITSFGIIYGCDKGSECKGKVKHIHFFPPPPTTLGLGIRKQRWIMQLFAASEIGFEVWWGVGRWLRECMGRNNNQTTTIFTVEFGYQNDAHRIQTKKLINQNGNWSKKVTQNDHTHYHKKWVRMKGNCQTWNKNRHGIKYQNENTGSKWAEMRQTRTCIKVFGGADDNWTWDHLHIKQTCYPHDYNTAPIWSFLFHILHI